METILDTLLYDGKVERSVSVDGSHLYRAVESLLPPPGIVRIPCGVCPVSMCVLICPMIILNWQCTKNNNQLFQFCIY